MTEAAEPVPGSAARRRAGTILSRSWLFLFLLGLIVFFWVATPPHTFLTGSNLSQIGLTTSEVIVLAIGETFVIVTAGIDLSVGGILFFSAVCGGKVMLALAGTQTQVANGQYPHTTEAVLVALLPANEYALPPIVTPVVFTAAAVVEFAPSATS